MTQKYRLKTGFNGWPAGAIVTKCSRDHAPSPVMAANGDTSNGH